MRENDFYGNNFKWFVGVVTDETTESRVKVRCFGIHPFDEQGSEPGAAQVAVSDGDLPWANLIYPIDSTIPNHDLLPEDWVFGFFADGDSAQQPVIVGKIARADGSVGSSFQGNGNTSFSGELDESYTEDNSGRDPGDTGGSTSAELPIKYNRSNYYSNVPGDTNQEKAFNFYTTYFNEEKGVPLEKAKMISAGIVASLIAESGTSLNTKAVGDTNTSSYAWGIAQWRLNRREGLYQMCGHKSGNIGCQLNFSITELENRNHGVISENSHPAVLKKLLESNSPYDAAYNWTVFYEIPADRYSKGKSRASTAQKVFDRLAPKFQRASIRSERFM